MSKDQGPWPPDPANFNIFLFGGSTTFGYGVTDQQTIASYLQDILSDELGRKVLIYNFGRGSYYSTQERILLERLFLSGFYPDIAIFIDGLNDFSFHELGEPDGADRLRDFLDKAVEEPSAELGLINKIPVVKLARSLGSALSGKEALGNQEEEIEEYIDKELLTNRVINRYFENKKMIESICAIHDVQPVFVWQPIPSYKYDSSRHRFNMGPKHSHTQYGYQKMATHVKENSPADNFLWCADILEDFDEPLYVDGVHYSPKACEILAATVSDLLIERDLVKINQ